MRFLKFLSIAILFGALSGCNEDIDLSGSNVPTAVVYAVICPQDTIHYVKITRAIGGNQNAIDVALISDSSYFPVLDATVKEMNGSTVVRTFQLRDTVLTNKSPGAWYYPNQKVYYFKTNPASPLSATNAVKLDISIDNGKYTITSTCQLVSGATVTSPLTNSALSFASSNVELDGYLSQQFNVKTGTAGIVEGRLKIYFDEYSGNTLLYSKVADWKLGEASTSYIANGSTSFTASGESFYNILKNNTTNDPTITKRIYRKTEFILSAGSSELAQYIQLNQPSTSLAQNKPTYTNLTASEGARVVGVFATLQRVTQVRVEGTGGNQFKSITPNSMKELINGSITLPYYFCTENALYPAWMCQ